MDNNEFFGRPAIEVAKDLLGRYLVKEDIVGRITKTGAYEEGKQKELYLKLKNHYQETLALEKELE